MELLSALAVGVFVWAAVTDVASRRIANRLVLALAAIGLLRIGVAAGGGEFARAAADAGAALAVFGAGAAIHRLGIVGGGDVKLFAAGALWLGAARLGDFLTVTALAGGVLGLGFLVWRGFRPETRPSLPYGVAIAFAGVWGTLAGV